MKYKLAAGVVFISCIVIALWSDSFTIFLQDRLIERNAYFIVGQAKIKPKENWVLFYKRMEGKENGKLYGFFPSNIYKIWPNSQIYNFKIAGKKEFLTFLEMDEKEANKIQYLLENKEVIEKYNKNYSLNGAWKLDNMYGQKVFILSEKNEDNEKKLYVPGLRLKILFPSNYDISQLEISGLK